MDIAPLTNALRRRIGIVADHALRDRDPAAHLEALKAASQKLNELVHSLPPDCDPMLRHFLERQSYTKALAWLQEQEKH